jgi:hypothetical protein
MRGIHDPSRRSVRIEATIRPPDHLVDIEDFVIRMLQEAGLGVDVISAKELGASDPEGEFDDPHGMWPPHGP